jgi:hypothetical protein
MFLPQIAFKHEGTGKPICRKAVADGGNNDVELNRMVAVGMQSRKAIA